MYDVTIFLSCKNYIHMLEHKNPIAFGVVYILNVILH